MTSGEHHPDMACSFCGKGASEVGHIIVGPAVWICDGCVRVCYEIIKSVEQGTQSDTGPDSPGLPVGQDPVLADIAQAQQLALRGDREEARLAFDRLWEQLGTDANPLHRVTLAHYMADVQDATEDELEWDLRALAAADTVSRDHPASAAIRGLYASLHLNVASCLDKLGRHDESRHHLAEAQQAESDLSPEGYGELVRSEIAALRGRLID